ncbi:hypothetical protein VTN49DRAFT_4651 [Thermomyces lanuginosus]|uniref:uncharacterized protein n=1 Tax=Thermomyces lanuginosus TaxID=5541 RepID=UPI003742F051
MMNDVISSTIGYDTVAIDYRLPANTLFSQKTLGTASPSVILRRMRLGIQYYLDDDSEYWSVADYTSET